ncbi:hypothetical protein [Ktedonospora formicarum]|uniref:DUF2029 domain-containing protein n=1 Tax=Ktedonospora formicarum TaxID=2778364 RepID=A0A8J3HWP5_9CHLR|nr:hypothetical protein [Ktedonospora formicarum]GHO45482.1 hypothetical protein KSX_36450 [Ktedonospora formicarum]
MNVENLQSDQPRKDSRKKKLRSYLFLLFDFVILAIMCVCIIGQPRIPTDARSDVSRYECYAAAFAEGETAFAQFPVRQCADIIANGPKLTTAVIVASLKKHGAPDFLVQFVASQADDQPLHYLPHEYPILTLIPFEIAYLISTPAYYQFAFNLLMTALAVSIYLLLLIHKSRSASISFALFLVIGYILKRPPSIAVNRFDMLPAALTFFALIFAMKSRWNWAFAMIALGTMTKFYPVILLPPFFIGQQMASRYQGLKWNAWQRILPFVTFCATCLIITIVSLLFSVEGTLAPLNYFGARPVQIESLQASLLWLSNGLSTHHLTAFRSFGSTNIAGPHEAIISLLCNGLLVVGLLATLWLQGKRRLTLSQAVLLFLMVVIITGKVFSPQYMIWLFPIAALTIGEKPLWIVAWSAVALLTYYIYPSLYISGRLSITTPFQPKFYPIVTARNFLLLGMYVYMLVRAGLQKSVKVQAEKLTGITISRPLRSPDDIQVV